MPTWVSPAVLGRLVKPHRPRRPSRARDLFDAYVRSRVRLKDALPHADVQAARVLAWASQRIPLPELATWEDLVVLRERFLSELPARAAATAARALLLAGEQLHREGALTGRPRHRGRARCRGCHRQRCIECVKHLLCPQCVGKRTLEVRFERLCARVRPEEPTRRATLDMLIEFERTNGVHHHSLLRVRYLAMALVRIPDIHPIRTWKHLATLRDDIDRVLPSGGAHQARWAVFKLGRVLLARGVLPHRLAKTTGPTRDQLRAPLDYFDDDDAAKRALLLILIDFYLTSRVTITAVQVVWAFAHHLSRNPTPQVTSWNEILDEGHRVFRAGGTWSRRILTAFLRVGDALERRGDIAARERSTDLPAILRRVDGDDDAARLTRQFVGAMHRGRRRPTTLLDLLRTVNGFWAWARERGLSHPAQISTDTIRAHLRSVAPAQRQHWCMRMRTYFGWLRRERLVLHTPIPDAEPLPHPTVRVTTRRAIEQLLRAMVDQQLPAEDALLLYLVLFHCVRNFEAARARFLGYEHGAARVAVPAPTDDARALPRPTHVLVLPTRHQAWLREIFDRVLDQRAAILKHPSTPYLFVRDSWRGVDGPLTEGTISRRIALATERGIGLRLTPTILRGTGATLAVDASDHSVCLFLGWSPHRAIDFAYARREVVGQAVEDENVVFKTKTNRSPKRAHPSTRNASARRGSTRR